MTITLTLHTADGPLTFIGVIVPPCSPDAHPSFRFSGLSASQASIYREHLGELVGRCIGLDELHAAIDRAGFQRALRAMNEARGQAQ